MTLSSPNSKLDSEFPDAGEQVERLSATSTTPLASQDPAQSETTTSFSEGQASPHPNPPRRSVSFKLPTMSRAAEKLASVNTSVDNRPGDGNGGSDERRVLESPVEQEDDGEEGEEVRDAIPNSTAQSQQLRRRTIGIPSRYYPVLVLENTGSVARDHLASERTFLAYVRTSLAIASTGVALVQLFTVSLDESKSNGQTVSGVGQQIQVYAKPLGSTAVGLGVAVLLIGLTRYFTVQHALTQGKFPLARVFIALIALALTVIIVVVFAVLVSR